MNDISIELSDFICVHCRGNNWEILVGHRSDNKTYLILKCNNTFCREKIEKELKPSDSEIIIHEEFEITGQGYDENDLFNEIVYENNDYRLN